MENAYFNRLLEDDTRNLTNGEKLVLREYLQSKKEGFDTLTITSICWEEDHAEIIRMLKEADFHTFVLADTSTGLMSTLHAFLNAGFEVKGPRIVKQPEYYWGKPVLGLEMRMRAAD